MFSLIEDPDGMWFVCPDEKMEEAVAYFDAVTEFWDDPRWDKVPPDWSRGHQIGEPDMPGWLDPLGGSPNMVKFPSYVIDRGCNG